MSALQRRAAQIVGLLLLLIIVFRALSGVMTDRWWYQALGLGRVWSGVIGAQLVLGLIGALVVFGLSVGSFSIIERTARPQGPAVSPVQLLVSTVGRRPRAVAGVAFCVLVSVALGTTLASHWDSWLRFRHGGRFGGISDPLYHNDPSFYIFKIPFISAVVNWLFTVGLILLILVAIGHYLFGGISVSPSGVSVTRGTRSHLLMLLAFLAFVRAAGYLVDRYKLVTSHLGVTDGAGYTDVHVRRPAMWLLTFVAVATGVVLLATIRQSGMLIPGVVMGLWAVLGVGLLGIAPAVVQALRVRPNELQKERTYIQRNIAATVRAYQLNSIGERAIEPGKSDVGKSVDRSSATISRVRLWDTSVAGDAMAALAVRQWFSLAQADIDRYNGQPVIVAPRQLDPSKLEAKGWVNRVLQYTHGYSLRVAKAAVSTRDGSLEQLAGLPQARLYIQDGLGGYAILGSGTREIDDGAIEHLTTTKVGVRMGGIFKRFAFALRFGEPNFLISGQIHPSSSVLWVRDVRARAKKAAPFLRFDSDPYPVEVNGKTRWVLDAYTTTTHYPYAQSAPISRLINAGIVDGRSGLASGFNYARNSVKAVVNADDGSVSFYVVDPDDPILKVYRRAFPKLFRDISKLGPLADHLRYPTDLFAVQAEIYGTYHASVDNLKTGATNYVPYHVPDADQLQKRNAIWPTSPDPETGKIEKIATANPAAVVPVLTGRGMAPQFLMLDREHLTNVQYLVSGSVDSTSRAANRPLSAIVTADVDRAGRPSLHSLVMRGEPTGPTQASSSFQQETGLSAQITVLNQAGSEVIQGALQVLPLDGGGLLYLRPIYVQAKVSPYPQLKYVAVSDGQRAAYDGTLAGALRKLFGRTVAGAADVGKPTGGAISAVPPGSAGTLSGPVIDQLQQASDDAQAALRNGDLAAYQAKVDEMGRLLKAVRAPTPATTTPVAGVDGRSSPTTTAGAPSSAATTPDAGPTTTH